MEKLNKIPQILKLFPIAALLITTLLYSSSLMRSASLYFIVNILMIFVAAEAGLLSFLKSPYQTNLKSIILKPVSVFSPDYYNEKTDAREDKIFAAAKEIQKNVKVLSPAVIVDDDSKSSPHDEHYEEKMDVHLDNVVTGKSTFLSEKILGAVKVEHVKKLISPLLPASIFFIGGGEKEDHPLARDDEYDDDDDDDDDDDAYDDEDQNGEESGELFRKAEAFIGDFYKQLKMQREN